jgi:hypothetical protein
MARDTSIKLKLSVWRDFNPRRSIIQWRDESSNVQLLSANKDLQQEVYCWQMMEDPFSGISDDSSRLRLHDLLLGRFDSSKPPIDRRVQYLDEFVEEARGVIEAGGSEWTISQDAPVDDEDAPYMMNPLLALALHLDWLRSSFIGQPGISISIR